MTLEMFLVGIPMVFNGTMIISPHGYFAQVNVLGMPNMTSMDR